MKRVLLSTLAVALAMYASGCAELRNHNEGPYDNPFYAKYLNTGSVLDAEITRTLNELRANPDSARLHNELGALLVRKGFPKDAEREFERSVNADRRFYPAWYNLGLVRASNDDTLGARRALRRTVALKPGHATALFQLGLIEEKLGNTDAAVKHYAKAYYINPALTHVRVNPRIVDSKLTHLALLKNYSKKQNRDSMQFQGAPVGYQDPQPPEAPSKEAPPQKILPPAEPQPPVPATTTT